MGFLSATSDLDLELLQDFDLSEFQGLFRRSENSDNNNNSAGAAAADGAAAAEGAAAVEGVSQAPPTPTEANQEAENAENPSEEQQVDNIGVTARCAGSRGLMQYHLRPAGGGGGGAGGGEAQRLRHPALRH